MSFGTSTPEPPVEISDVYIDSSDIFNTVIAILLVGIEIQCSMNIAGCALICLSKDPCFL